MDSVDHFRKQLASEIKRMTEMCETWEKISQQNVLPETVQVNKQMCFLQVSIMVLNKVIAVKIYIVTS